MKSISRMFPMAAAGALAVALALPSAAQAQGAPRAGSVEFILPLIYTPSTSFNGQGGSSADVNANLGFGFGTQLQPQQPLSGRRPFNWSSRNYQATLVDSPSGAARYSDRLPGVFHDRGQCDLLLGCRGGFTPFLIGRARQHVHRHQHSNRSSRRPGAGTTPGTDKSAAPTCRRKRRRP